MLRKDVFQHIKEEYNVTPDFPWMRTPNYAIFRHLHNRKWFGAIVDVTEDKLGLNGNKLVDGLLLKCDPLTIGALLNGKDILPGYHMNKEHWITIVLGGDVPAGEIYDLIELSYSLTK